MNSIYQIALSNSYPISIIKNWIIKQTKSKIRYQIAQQQQYTWVTFQYHSSLIKKTPTYLNILIYVLHSARQIHCNLLITPKWNANKYLINGIYCLKCNVLTKYIHVGQTGRYLRIKFLEHQKIQRQSKIWICQAHLNNKLEYGPTQATMQLKKACNKGWLMNCSENKFFCATISASKILDGGTEYCWNKSLIYSRLWLKHSVCRSPVTTLSLKQQSRTRIQYTTPPGITHFARHVRYARRYTHIQYN